MYNKELEKKLSDNFKLPVCDSAYSVFNYLKKDGDRCVKEVQVWVWSFFPEIKWLLIDHYKLDKHNTFSFYYTIVERTSENSYRIIQYILKDFSLENFKRKEEEEEKENLSECCGAEIMEDIWLCSDCKEHVE